MYQKEQKVRDLQNHFFFKQTLKDVEVSYGDIPGFDFIDDQFNDVWGEL